ncbi:MAG: OmpA family protein [Burkholderiales bacterium]|nr:OmpA family protein [Burkholderiales bacterium]
MAILVAGATCAAQAQSQGTVVPSGPATVQATYVTNIDKEDLADLATVAVSRREVVAGLFPEDLETAEQRSKREACERIIQAGYKCMPPVRTYTRYSLPGVSFGFASAVLPEGMKQQLKSFADAISGRSGASPVVRVDGHADATGNEEFNKILSQKRAESVVEYLVSLGVDKKLLTAIGFGSERPRNTNDPKAAENRRVEISRVTARVQIAN